MTDWAVHSVIDRNSWSRGSLAFMDRIFEQNKFWDQLTPEEQQRFASILSLENGRMELMDVFRKAHVFPVAFGHPIGWRVFLGAFLDLINDCPLRLTHGRVVDSVTMNMLVDPIDSNKLYINWKFTRVDRQEPFIITLPMIVERPTFHFGRGGKAAFLSLHCPLFSPSRTIAAFLNYGAVKRSRVAFINAGEHRKFVLLSRSMAAGRSTIPRAAASPRTPSVPVIRMPR